MARYIDADKLRERIEKWMPSDPCGRVEEEKPFEQEMCAEMIMAIDDIPTEDVAPVIHAKWMTGIDGLTPYCTHCRRTHHCLQRCPDHCPNCGARMDGE